MDPIRAYVGHERDSDIEAWDGIVTWRTLLSADRTPTRSITAGVAIIEPDASEEGAEHHHADDEIYYFVAGTGEVVLDGVAHEVTEGSVVFVPGNTRHFVRNTGAVDLKLFYAFCVDQFSDVVYRYD